MSISGANSYENDGIELCFDGDNAKTDGAYDDNDLQYRWVWSMGNDAGAPNSVCEWGELDSDLEGYTAEIMIPASDLTFDLEDGAEVGFEIQINERDNEARENMMRWWGDDNMTWTDASLMGTVVLIGTPGAVEASVGVNDFALAQNYPNPFNPSTTIQFNLAKRGMVKLNVYDVLGNQVANLVNDVRSTGPHAVSFDGSDLSSGVYFYTLETATEIITKKMMLMK